MDRKYIGVDIGGTSIKLGLITDEGTVLSRMESVYTKKRDHKHVMDAVFASIRELLEKQALRTEDIAGIGVSTAGCINSVTGSVAQNGGNIRDWSGTEVVKQLRAEFGLPASVANDGNCAVLGEFWAGAAQGYTDVLGIILGTGVGGGVITGGRLLEGAHGFAGELGHFPTHAGGDHCVCGLDGCFERYASTSSLTRKAAAKNEEFESGRKLFGAAGEGDKHALALLDSWTTEIAYGITGFIHVFDPQLVLIGGGVSVQEKLLIEPLREKVLSLVMPDFAADLEFRAASLGNDAGMIGAVYYLMSKQDAMLGK